jgi:transcription initiation factor TFIID subunit 2
MAEEVDAEAVEGRVSPPPTEEPDWRPFVVTQQNVDIEVDFAAREIHGASTIVVSPLSEDVEEVYIDARQCRIDLNNVTVDGTRTSAYFEDPYDRLTTSPNWLIGPKQHGVIFRRLQDLTPRQLPDAPLAERDQKGCVPAHGSLRVKLQPEPVVGAPPRRAIKLKKRDSTFSFAGGLPSAAEGEAVKTFTIRIPFRTKRIRDGLQFVGIDDGDARYPHVFTRHSIEPGMASSIFPCVDDIGVRVPWNISVKFPRTVADVYDSRIAGLGGRNGRASELARASLVSLSEEDKLREMTVVCSGTVTGETVDSADGSKKIMHFEIPRSMTAQHVGFVVGPFELVELWYDCRTEEMDDKLGDNAVKVQAYCLPSRRAEVVHTCAPVVSATDYFMLHFGSYPFDDYKLCFVDDMLPDTAHTCSLTLCSSRLLYPEDTIDPEMDSTRTLVHAVATQFVGVHIVPNRPSDNWLVIGMQWYMTDIFLREICGNNFYRFQQKTMSDKLVEMDVERPSLHDLGSHLHLGDFEMDFMALKAPLLLFILDQRMKKIPGNTGVFRVISRMVSNANINADNAMETFVSVDAFTKLCEKQSQVRTDGFLKQWVRGSGCPRFHIRQKFNKKNTTVELNVHQTQAEHLQPPRPNAPVPPKRRLQRTEFFREVRELQEESNNLFAKDVQAHFTGPLSIQIHEADGKPYEHLVEIQDSHVNGAEWKLNYYTKYKRLKKKRRQKELVGVAQARGDGGDDGRPEDVAYYSCFGDVLQSDAERHGWGIADWGEEDVRKMETDSYEWIGIDTDFEWLCRRVSDMQNYMYLAQLQQDRDVVQQQDALLAITSRNWVHPMASTILTRTLMDKRYYYGLRLMAARHLPTQATREMNMLGLAQLVLSYRELYCYEVVSAGDAEAAGDASQARRTANNTQTSHTASASSSMPPGEDDGGRAVVNAPRKKQYAPLPNDFSDKSAYYVQSVIPGAIAQCRGEDRRCPKNAREILMELLMFNDNAENPYSDQHFIAKLLEALTTSVITEVDPHARELIFTLRDANADDWEFKEFLGRVINEIDRFRRMDEWTRSYHNVWTTTALDCKRKLMKARIIPAAPIEFVQYLQEGNSDFIRITAFECLVDLGFLLKPVVLRLFLTVSSTDPSPFVRDQLFKIFAQGIGAIALGDAKVSNKTIANAAAEEKEDDEDDQDPLIVQAGEVVTAEKQADEARKTDLTKALAALKEELKDHKELLSSMWNALQSPTLGVAELRNLLALCAAIWEPEDMLELMLHYPRSWSVARAPDNPKGKVIFFRRPARLQAFALLCADTTTNMYTFQLIMNFTSVYRTQPRSRLQLTSGNAAAAEAVVRPPEPKKIKIQGRPSMNGITAVANSQTPLRQPSLPIPESQAAADSIAVARPAVAAAAPAVSQHLPARTPLPSGSPKLSGSTPARSSKKRESEASDESEQPRKKAKTRLASRSVSATASPMPQMAHVPSRMVKLSFSYSKMPEILKKGLLDMESSYARRHGTSAGDASIMTAPARGSLRLTSPSPAPFGRHGGKPIDSDDDDEEEPLAAKIRKPLPVAAPPSEPAASGAPAPARPSIKLKIKLPGK